ncbi:UDP-N-acetylglucosamine 2-epimerase (hydrolyzing), partial [Patescibacteria group bacterium]|nr:UDP-N-acetylglucosamine 2-epimerase (hydrolyzing) [Patescibacteria group bacterium]
LEGNETITKAKTAGLGLIEFTTLYNKIKPDLVVIRGDRFEILAAALAAAYMNIPVAHIEGGDLSGTIDESVRHAITKMAHIHFATNEASKNRILKMGERPEYVFNYGSPEIEVVERLANQNNDNINLNITGSGADLDFNQSFLMVIYHPVTTEIEKTSEYTRILLQAIYEFNQPTLWFWPNYDAGAEDIAHELRVFKDKTPGYKVKFMRFLPPKKFLTLLKNTQCLIGNSSAGIKECSYLGIPVVNVGSRQQNRLRGSNIMDVEYDKEKIKKVISKQLMVGRYPKADLYFSNNTSRKIAETLATIKLYIQKSFVD